MDLATAGTATSLSRGQTHTKASRCPPLSPQAEATPLPLPRPRTVETVMSTACDLLLRQAPEARGTQAVSGGMWRGMFVLGLAKMNTPEKDEQKMRSGSLARSHPVS